MASGTPDELQEILEVFDAALQIINREAVEALQKLRQEARASIAAGFRAERYYTDAGKPERAGGYGKAWRTRKRKLGYEMDRGHATGGIQSALGDERTVRKTKRGFSIDFTKSTKTTSYRNLTKASRKVAVRSYISHYAAKKAPSLGALPKPMRDKLNAAVMGAVGDKLAKVAQSASKGFADGKGFIDFQLKVDSFEIGKAA